MTINDILNYKLKKLLGAEKADTIEEEDKKFILAQAEDKIKNYCHINIVPTGAYYVWADMAIEILKGIDSSLFADQADAELESRITSVSAGDTTINFAKEIEDANSNTELNSDVILVKFSLQLQSFRKLSRGSGCIGY